MRRIQKWGIALAAITAGTQLNTTEACTRVVYQGKDNTVLTARSMDWKEDTRSNLWIFPRGMKRNGEIGKNPLEWTSKYGSVVASAYDICSTDGMNEKGLAVSVLKLDGKPTHQRTGKPQITTTAALRLMLDKAANVDEALALLEKYDMNSSMETANFHFLLSDADGKNVVLEYTIDDMTVIDTNYVANHYLAPKMHGLGHAYDRFAVLDSAVKFKKSIFTPFEAMSLLSLVSQPETEDATSMTQWSVVYNLHDLTAQVAIRRNYDKLFNFTLADLSGKAKI